MSLIGHTDLEQRLRRVELENEGGDSSDTQRLEREVDDINRRLTGSSQTPTVPTRQGIDQMLRNTDHNHSVNTWWETVVSATDKDLECANVYCYPPIASITVTDASTHAASDSLETGDPVFTLEMEGRYVQVDGAGVAGAVLIAKILNYISPTQVQMDTLAPTGIGPTTARINLQLLGHTNKKNSAGTNPNDTLKDVTHSQIVGLTAISDPDWDKTRGVVRLGSSNCVGYSFGRFDSTGANYVALHQLFSGREPFFRLNLARANQYVKIRGRLYLGIYNNDTRVLDYVKGSNLTLVPTPRPIPSSTVSTDYMVVLETGQGFSIVSDVLTIANAPTDAAMAAGAKVSLVWQYYAGVVSATVYRRRAAGNVFKMETFATGANTWTDVNLSTRVDTGTVNFPDATESVSAVRSYWASQVHEFDDLLYDGEPDRFWQPISGRLPFPPSVNMGMVFDPFFVIGLTEPLSTYLTDAETHSSNTVDSAAAQFSAAMNGKTFELIKADGSATVMGTVTYVSATQITLSVVCPWTESGSKLEILDSQPHGLLYDLVGVSFNEGEWAFHPEDNSELRGQQVASNPNGSTQGGTGGQDPTGGGGGGGVERNCVLDEALVSVRGGRRWFNAVRDRIRSWFGWRALGKWKVVEKRAIDVDCEDDLVWNGQGFEDRDFNEINWISVKIVDRIWWMRTDSKLLPGTRYHRVVDGPLTFKIGIPVGRLVRGRKVLISDRYSSRVEAVLSITPQTGRFRVVSFGLKQSDLPTAALLVVNGVVSHNRKNENEIEVF